jgi:hypothetical protein
MTVAAGTRIALSGAMRRHPVSVSFAFVFSIAAGCAVDPAVDDEELGDIEAAAGVELRGTWVLHQVSSIAALDQQENALQSALARPGVVGLSIRVPWNAIEKSRGVYDFAIFARARQIAGGKKLAIRFMAGRWTPAFRTGRTYVYDGSSSGGYGAGSVVPCPFNTDGSRNEIFLQGIRRMTAQLATWGQANGVAVLHGAWPGMLWAEVGVPAQMTTLQGYSYAVVRDFHRAVIDHLLAQASPAMNVELPVSGYAPSTLWRDIHLRWAANPRSGLGLLQRNDLTDRTNWPAMSSPPRRAAQMYDQRNSYDWAQVYDNVRAMSGEYLEVYTPSFAGGSAAQLAAEADAFHP